MSGCRPDNTTLVDCSGRGSCVCGQCECERRGNPDEVIMQVEISLEVNF